MADTIEEDFKKHGYGYHYPRLYGTDIKRVWDLRKAGLGLLSGMPGSAKPVSVIEDTAVAPERLPAYMKDFGAMLERMGLSCVYHAHIATGELHLRPVLDLKKERDRRLFRQVAEETALLVKKHKGALSGEHGDGRLRGEFIPVLFGQEVYEMMREVKRCWDPAGIFNRGKIVDTPPMDKNLRVKEDHAGEDDLKTYFDFSRQKVGMRYRQCNGSGDCGRKPSSGERCVRVFGRRGMKRIRRVPGRTYFGNCWLVREPNGYSTSRKCWKYWIIVSPVRLVNRNVPQTWIWPVIRLNSCNTITIFAVCL